MSDGGQGSRPTGLSLRRSLTRSSTIIKSQSARFFRGLRRRSSWTMLLNSFGSDRSDSSLAFAVVDYDNIYSFVCNAAPPMSVEEINNEEYPDKVYSCYTFTVKEVNTLFPKRIYGSGELLGPLECEHMDYERRMGVCDCWSEAVADNDKENSTLLTKAKEKIQKYTECSICIEPFKDEDSVRILTCGHVYHESCVKVWLVSCSADCPTCRCDFSEKVPIRWAQHL